MRRGFILRIVGEENERLVFSNRRYYTGLRRRFEPGVLIFFLMKKNVDSFVGYGEIEEVTQLRDLENEEEIKMCIMNGWTIRLSFGERFEKFSRPLPLKDVFPGLQRLGRALHGLELNNLEIERIFSLRKIYMD